MLTVTLIFTHMHHANDQIFNCDTLTLLIYKDTCHLPDAGDHIKCLLRRKFLDDFLRILIQYLDHDPVGPLMNTENRFFIAVADLPVHLRDHLL